MTGIATHPADGPGGHGVADPRPWRGWYLLLAWTALLAVQVPLLGAGERRAVNLGLSDLVLVTAVLVGVRQWQIRRQAISIWHLLLPIVLATSVLFGGVITRYTVGNKIVGIVVMLLSYTLITSFATSWRRIHLVMRVFVLGVTVVSSVTALAHLVDVRLPMTRCHSSGCVRLSGYFHDANLFGALVAMALAMHLATMGTSSRLVKRGLPAAFVIVSLGGGLLLSLSRSSWIGMSFVVLALLVLKSGKGSRVTVGAGAVVAGVLVYVIASRSDLLLRTATRSHSIDSRLDIIDNAMAALSENPAFGIGLGSFAERYDTIVHNTTLWLAAEMGMIGLIVFAGLMVWVWRRLVWLYRNTHGDRRAIVLALGLAHGSMLAFSIGVEALYQRHWWMVMGLLAAAFTVATSEAEDRAGRAPPAGPAEPAVASRSSN